MLVVGETAAALNALADQMRTAGEAVPGFPKIPTLKPVKDQFTKASLTAHVATQAGVEPKEVKASFANGVLTVTMPKNKLQEQARKIPVQAGEQQH